MNWLRGLREEIGIPGKLRDLGIDDSKAEEISRAALNDPTAPTNPIPLTEFSLAALLRTAISRSGATRAATVPAGVLPLA